MPALSYVHIEQVAAPSPGFDLYIIDLDVEYPDGYVRDVNGTIQLKDVSGFGPRRLKILATKVSTTMTNFNSLEHWRDTRERLDIEDFAFTPPAGNAALDAYHYRYRGYIESISGIRALSPEKMILGEWDSFEIVFLVDEYWVITV